MTDDEKKTGAEKTPLHTGFMDELKGLFMGRPKPSVTLGERVEQLENQAEIEEERTKLIKRGLAAKGRINKALLDRHDLSGPRQRRFSTTQLLIIGVLAVVLIVIFATAVHC